jgi:hypothetical protein
MRNTQFFHQIQHITMKLSTLIKKISVLELSKVVLKHSQTTFFFFRMRYKVSHKYKTSNIITLYKKFKEKHVLM